MSPPLTDDHFVCALHVLVVADRADDLELPHEVLRGLSFLILRERVGQAAAKRGGGRRQAERGSSDDEAQHGPISDKKDRGEGGVCFSIFIFVHEKDLLCTSIYSAGARQERTQSS